MNNNWSTPYKFNGKLACHCDGYWAAGREKDEETGMYYYGARYYIPELSIWGSVDPLSDKYPSMSPFMYCAGNPVRLVDPNGMEVEHSTLKDKLYTSTLRIFSSTFRNQYRILKKSTETYVFQGFSDGSGLKDGEFTTDGEKLFINYNYSKNESQGTNWTNHLKHESEHGVQFEHGEFGFIFENKGWGILDRDNNYFPHSEWTPYNFDLSDEKKARDVGFSGITLNPNIDNTKNSWNNKKFSDKDRYQALINAEYNGNVLKNNTNNYKIKSESSYMMPFKKR